MNILLFPRILAKTGVGNHVVQLSDELIRQGHNVIVVSSSNDLSKLNNNVKFFNVDADTHNPVRLMKTIKQLHNIVKDNKVDVVHCHHRVPAAIMHVYCLIYRKIPVVYTLHLSNVPCDFIHRVLSFGGDINIGVSSDVSDFMINKLKFKADTVITVCNGVNNPLLEGPITSAEIDSIKHEWDIDRSKNVYVMHSRIDEIKNHLLVVEAVHRLPKDFRDNIIVVCSGTTSGDYYERVIAAIKDYAIEDNFRFVGWTSTRKIMSIADCLLAPSLNEGFLLTVAEAFMMHVLVARSVTPGFDDQKYCLPISSNDPQDIIDLVCDINEYGLVKYSERITEAYDYALKNFTVEAMTHKTVDIYKKVCKR